MKKVRWVGLDVHADSIAVAVAEPTGEVRSLGQIPNRPESIRKLMKKLGPADSVRACYEAGPTGSVIYWQLTTPACTVRWWRPRWCQRRRAIASRRIGAMRRSWRDATAPAI
jgi:hypothetical protein